jgi:cytochrome P450
VDLVIDEVLRIDDPFVSNRRVTTAAVDLGGVRLPAGARVKLHWTSVNRDECVFSVPDAFDPARHEGQPGLRRRTPCLPRPAARHP